MALTKVSGGILDPGINVAGIVTATGFDGPFTGGSNGINAGIITATSLDLNGNGNISGNLVVGGNLTANGNFTTLNTTLREVEVLHVDADSNSATAGIITQRGAGDILNLSNGTTELFTVVSDGNTGIGTNNPKINLEVVGSGVSVFNQAKNAAVDISGAGKIELIRSDSVAYIDFKTSYGEDFDCRIQQYSNGLRFFTGGQGSTDERLRITSDGNVLIDTTVATEASTDFDDLIIGSTSDTAKGISIVGSTTGGVGSLAFTDGASYKNQGIIQYRHADDSMRFITAQYERLRITSTGVVGIGTTNPTGAQKLNVYADSNGTGGILQITQQGTGDAAIDFQLKGTREYSLGIDNSDDDKFKLSSTAGLDSNTLLTVTTDGKVGIGSVIPDATLDLQSTGQEVLLRLNTKPVKNGYLDIFSDANRRGVIRFGDTDGTYRWSIGNGDSDELTNTSFHISSGNSGGNNAKFVIDSNGDVGINQTNPTQKLHVGGSIKLTAQIMQSMPADFWSQGNTFIELNGLGNLTHMGAFETCLTSNGYRDTNGQWVSYAANSTTGAAQIRLNPAGTINFGTEATKADGSAHAVTTRWKIDSSGHFLPGAADSYNIGSTSAEIGNVYVADSKNIFFGSDQDAEIYHNGGSGFYLNNSTGNTYIRSGGGQIIMRPSSSYDAIVAKTNEVELYYNSQNHSTPKLKTSATGITVDGEVAASQDYPNFRPTLDLNFAAEKKLDPRITYYRSGCASYVDEFGLIKLVGSNVPRFDHDPMTGECKGLLMEESRTNYILDSLRFDRQHWAFGIDHPNNQKILIDNSVRNPDGSLGAFYRSSSDETYANDPYCDLSGASTDTITVSLFVKERSGVSGGIDIEIFSQISPSAVSLGAFAFDPATATVTTADANFSDGRVEEFPNGWYRVSAKVTTNSGNFTSTTRMDIQSAPHYMWGPQVEAGSYPTSFIPTFPSAASRGVDVATIDEDEFTEFYNDDEWTMITHTNVDNSQSLVASASEVNSINFQGDNNTKKFTTRYVTNSTNNQAYVDAIGAMSGSGLYDLVGGGVGNYNMKTAHAAKVNDVAASFNGGTVQTDTSVTMLTGGSILNIGQNPKRLHVIKFMYYPKRLPNSQLVTLTS